MDVDRDDLIALLARHMAAGNVDPGTALPVVRELAGDDRLPLIPLLEALEDAEGAAAGRLVGHLQERRRQEALRVHRMQRSGQALPDETRQLLADLPLPTPVGWRTEKEDRAAIQSALSLQRDRRFLASRRDDLSRIFAHVDGLFQAAAGETLGTLNAWGLELPADRLRDGEIPERADLLSQLEQSLREDGEGRRRATREMLKELPETLPAHLDETETLELLAERHAGAPTRQECTRALDLLCAWPTPRVAGVLAGAVQEPWAQRRAALILTCRFGLPAIRSWDGWHRWLLQREQEVHNRRRELERLVDNRSVELLALWHSQQPDRDPRIEDMLAGWWREHVAPVHPEHFVDLWGPALSEEEWQVLSGRPARQPVASPSPPVPALPSAEPEPEAPPAGEAPPAEPERPPAPQPVEPIGPPPPSLWRDHVQPFFAEYWYLAAGVAMVLVGASILAYYTWDKHWLLRYTLMPALLATFTASLAAAGSWIEKKEERLKATAAILRGAAIGLLPINFMAVALLSGDADVGAKGLVVPLMGLIYLAGFGYGLRRWCAAVDPALGTLLGGCLLAVNSLVVLGPLATAVAGVDDRVLRVIVGAGFYVGFLVVAAAVVRFARQVLTREMAAEKRVPWFLGATLALTYCQVFAWVHSALRQLPEVYTYGPLVILTGWLVLVVERRTLELRDEEEQHGGESFLGFALILLGTLMAASEPRMRVLGFLLAGGVWLYQNLARRHALHDWIGLTLTTLGGASVGLLPGFPEVALPALGIVLALAVGFLGRRLGDRAPGLGPAVLLLTAVVAPLVQWNEGGEPLLTAAYLLVIAALFAWQALRDDQRPGTIEGGGGLRWLHTTMALVALALPYLGFVDVGGRTLQGNTMVFGLGLLSLVWLGVVRALGTPMFLAARSTVVQMYGSLAVGAMLLRVVLERDAYSAGWQDFMDLAGPLLMTVALVAMAYHSRSLLPAGMAVFIAVVLFPVLRTDLRSALPVLGWGSGLGSAASALAMVLFCFVLRRAPWLRELGEGDLYMGREPFPLLRNDHRLFTWPLTVGALFLTLRVETWTLAANLFDDVGLRTALALILTGAVWTLLGIFYRHRKVARIGVHLGWIWLLIGSAFANVTEVADPHWTYPFLATGLVLQGLYWLYRRQRERHPWTEDILARPTRSVLRIGSLVLSFCCVVALVAAALVAEADPFTLLPLLVFLAAQLAWHGLATRQLVYGVFLFPLLWLTLLALVTPGESRLFPHLAPTLWLLLAVQVVFVALEARQALYERLAPLAKPFLFWSSALAAGLVVAGIHDALVTLRFPWSVELLLLAVIVFTARAHGSGLMALAGAVFAYLLIHYGPLGETTSFGEGLDLVLEPWRWSLLALALATLGYAGSWLADRPTGRRWLVGPFAMRFFASPSAGWLLWPAAASAVAAAGLHTVTQARDLDLAAPFFGALALIVVIVTRARRGRRGEALGSAAVALVALGNIHAVRSFTELLTGYGLSEIHLVCLGLAATLLLSSLVRLGGFAGAVTVFLNRASLVLAGGVLVLLAANYLAHPDLEAVSELRFIVSGAMTLLAGWYFRRAARRPGPGEEPYTDWTEGCYHFGVTMALWCAALLIPWLRQPATALAALGLPVLYFHVRAEADLKAGLDTGRRYRNSAAVLGFAILGLYVFRGVFHLVLFPGVAVDTGHYHDNSWLIMVLALVLLRLHGLGGTSWLAFYGGLALVTGSYFALTALPGLDPFRHPVAGAWCAVGLGHFWTLVTSQRSPLKTAIQDLAGLDLQAWFGLRRSWGLTLLVATQAAALWGIVGSSDSHAVAPLLLGAASLFIHQGVLRRLPLYFAVAGLEIALALHADFLLPSYLAAEHVIWVVLALWVALLVLEGVTETVGPSALGWAAAGFAAATFGHVLYHLPGSAVGLWGMAIGALAAACTPRASPNASSPEEHAGAAVLLWIPTWLVYFSQVGDGQRDFLASRPLLALAAAVLATGIAGRYFQTDLAEAYGSWRRDPPRLLDQTLTWLAGAGSTIMTASLWVVFVLTFGVQVFYYGRAFEVPELFLVCGLHAAAAVAWYYQERYSRSMTSYVALQLHVLGFFAAIRNQLWETTDFWSYEYDVWASLAVSFGLAGAKQLIDLEPRQIRLPLLGTLFVLPLAALGWVLVHGLGVDVALIVIGLHSLIFAYMGRGERESPYHLVAIGGFVGFVVLTFWSKLELRVLQAYTVPVGLGILVLLHLFEERIEAAVRHRVRLVTVLAMLGSAAYYALVDDRFPIAFHLTLILLCLAAMGLGSFFRVTLYLTLGFGGLVVDLASIVYKVMAHMQRSARMTTVGALVLALGVALVFGAAYYKTRQREVSGYVEGWRRRFASWE